VIKGCIAHVVETLSSNTNATLSPKKREEREGDRGKERLETLFFAYLSIKESLSTEP
jgi:hypothetical protein